MTLYLKWTLNKHFNKDFEFSANRYEGPDAENQ